jgi:hypothetical protein
MITIIAATDQAANAAATLVAYKQPLDADDYSLRDAFIGKDVKL